MNRSISLRSLSPALALLALLPASCASHSTGASSAALDAYSRSFAPAQVRPIANALEVTAPRMEQGPDQVVRLAGAEGAREVRVQMLEPKAWGEGVERLSARADPAAQAQLSDEALETALASGLIARSGELKAARTTLTLRLQDVEIPATGQSAQWVDVTLGFVRVSAATIAAVRTAGPAGGAATVQRLSGD